MNKLEKLIYDLVKKKPWLKDSIKYIYQLIMGLISKKEIWSVHEIITRDQAFFGFHDKDPWSHSGKYLLSHDFQGVGNEDESFLEKMRIVVYEGEGWRSKKEIAETTAWNWQQGSQLQWLGQTHKIIYNDFHEGFNISRIVDVETNESFIHKYPVGAVSPNGKKWLSFCFKSFGKAMPGYGYRFGDNISPIQGMRLTWGEFDTEKIYELDGSNLSQSKLGALDNGLYFLSHAQFSPNSDGFAFMKRLAISGSRILSELYYYDLSSQSCVRLPFTDMVSHFCFTQNNEILAFANGYEGDGYYLFDLKTSMIKNVTRYLNSVDGHPNCCFQNGEVVFDTYPDKTRHQDLYSINLKTFAKKHIAHLYAPMKFQGSRRVDLHPRLRRDGKYICFDSSFNEVRSLSTMRL